jgi:O-acetylhomoserine (thiol)-lyase
VDATLATPYLLRPIEFGADIVCHSATKYLSGHGTTLAGVVTEKGGFDWANGNFPHINAFIDEGVGSVGSDDDPRRTLFTRRLRYHYMAELGGQLEPMSAFLLLQGLETLSLRMERHAENAIAVASFLEAHPAVSSVAYPSLPSSPFHALARKYFPLGSGAMLAVRLDGGPDAARRMIERLRVFDFLEDVGDSRSRITHPATSTHSGLSDQVRERAGVFDDSLRISVGTEDVGDLIRDLRQALATKAATVVVPPDLLGWQARRHAP